MSIPDAQFILDRIVVDPVWGCWEWQQHLTAGYGRYNGSAGRKLAHRLSYEIFYGPIPGGLPLDHLCRNHCCVNPAHLEAVTSRENALRGTSVSAVNAAKTHCDSGHEFTPENTRPRKVGVSRQCRACHREDSRKWARNNPEKRRTQANASARKKRSLKVHV